MDFKPPLASEAIKAIQALIETHGDLPIVLEDPDTEWYLPIGVEKQVNDGISYFAIVSEYYGEPDSCIGDYLELGNE